MIAAGSCEICSAPLGVAADEAVCRGCLASGAQWAHRQIVRLWNSGKTAPQIATELGYTRASIDVIVRRLRKQGYDLERRRTADGRWAHA